MVATLAINLMSDPAWIIKWRAREALTNGQPEEAHRLLDELLAAGNRRAFALRTDVINGYLERAERCLSHDDSESAWRDLRRLEQLAKTDGKVVRLRETLTRLELDSVRAALDGGHALQALKNIARLKERQAQSPEIAPLEQAAQDWIIATESAERGEFTTARTSLDRVRQQVGNRSAGLDRFEQDLVRREDRFRDAWSELQDAVEKRDWREMLRQADEVLVVAPRHKEAQQARNRAWQAGQPETMPYRPVVSGSAGSEDRGLDATVEAAEAAPAKRFFLWIDGVGAWLVCLNPRISIGQASTDGGPVDVPLWADVSRFHASLTRDAESYVLESNRDMTVNGKPVTRTVLQTGDRIGLAACEMIFQLPVPGCLSARLMLSGGRRLPMAVDGILLMADMVVLGSSEKVHVRMPELEQPVYLFRQKEQLGVRWPGEFRIDGQSHKDRANLPWPGSVSSDAFTFAIEPVGR